MLVVIMVIMILIMILINILTNIMYLKINANVLLKLLMSFCCGKSVL